MNSDYSLDAIKAIELHYGICLPTVYKTMLLLLGGKVLNLDKTHEILSIYEIQGKIKSLIEDDSDDPTYRLKKVFFITNTIHSKYDEYDAKDFFIEPKKQADASISLDCPVYYWSLSPSCEQVIGKFSDNLEEWLRKVNPLLYTELQAKKIFFDVSTMK